MTINGGGIKVDGVEYRGFATLNVTVGAVLNITVVDPEYHESDPSLPMEWLWEHSESVPNFLFWEDSAGFYSTNRTILYTVPDVGEVTLLAYYNYTIAREEGENYFLLWRVGTSPSYPFHPPVNRLILVGDRLYTQSFEGQNNPVTIWNVSGLNLTYISISIGEHNSTFIPQNFEHFYVDGNYLYGTHSGSDVISHTYHPFDIYDVSDPMDVRLVGYLDTYEDGVYNGLVYAAGDYAYVFNRDRTDHYRLLVYNVSNRSEPQIICEVEVEEYRYEWYGSAYFRGMLRRDNLLYLLNAAGSIVVFDVSNHTNVKVAAVLYLNATLYDMAFAGDLLFLACGTEGVRAYNITGGTELSFIGEYKATLRDTRAIDYHNGVLYVADGYNGLHVLNASDPGRMSEIAHEETIDCALDLVVDRERGRVYVADYFGGLMAYNITDPAETELTQRVNPEIGIGEYGYNNYSLFAFLLLPKATGSSGGLGSCYIDYLATDFFGVRRQITSGIEFFEVLLYNDTDRDGILTEYYYTSEHNPNLVESVECIDPLYAWTNMSSKDVIVTLSDPYIRRENNITTLYVNVTYSNAPLIFAYEGEPSYMKGRINVTYTFEVSSNLRNSTFEVKWGAVVTPYNLSGDIPQDFSIWNGYMVTSILEVGCVGAGWGVDITLNATSGLFTLTGIPVAVFKMDRNYTLTEDGTDELKEAGISMHLGWFGIRDINYPDRVHFGANFHNVSNMATVDYDPRVIIGGNYTPYSGFITQLPPEEGEEQPPPEEVVDFVPPTIIVSVNPLNPDTTTSVTFNITVNDDINGTGIETIRLYIDGELVQVWSEAGTHIYTGGPYSAGTHTYHVEAVDKAGNEAREPKSGSNTFTVSSTP
ncbi:hypothetical protein DRO55_06485, partial [Candidatus Bathyarchaeota archaeon]